MVQTHILAGGPGQDNFICSQGKDTILDFNATQGDSVLNDCEGIITTDNNIAGKQMSNGSITDLQYNN